MAEREIDAASGTETTGHQWDGIKELNTPLPRWWLWTFYATIAWSAVYCVLYPAWPLVASATSGVLGYSSRAEVADDIEAARRAQSGLLGRISTASLDEIRTTPDLFQFAVAGGKSAYAVNCSQCHGSGASGGAGYPNLNDDVWLWGGALGDIYTTIAHGIRFDPDDDTRISDMPAFGRDELLEPAGIADIAEFVLSLSSLEHDRAAADRGATLYAENCADCHGERGAGNREVGAPALNDALWHYSGDRSTVIAQISAPKHGVMPAWAHRLDDAIIKQLAVYVHALGGGE
jgi:cytochrome c oxidase cbb3-type subunit 3